MKKLIFLLLSAVSLSASAQVVTRSYDSDEFTQLISSRTSVVLVGNAAYDTAIRDAVTKYWKATPVDFIDLKDISKSITDKSKSFLLPFIISVTYTHPGASARDYSKLKSWLGVINGGKKKLDSYSDGDAVCLAGFNYYGDEQEYTSSAYRLEYMVKGINDGIQITKEKQISGGMMKMPFNVMKELNKNAVNLLGKKTLVINKDTKSSISKKPLVNEEVFSDAKYPYKYKYVGDAEFKDILKGNDPNYLCLVPAIEVNKHVMVYEPATRNTVYYGWAMQGLKITKGDIEDMMEGKK